MQRNVLAAFSIIGIIAFLGFTARLNRSSPAPPQELNVISRTRGDEFLSAEVLNNELRIRLKNNHKDTITAFAISFRDTTIKVDFAYSEVNSGIQPGDTFQKNYPIFTSASASEPFPLYLVTVLLNDGTNDGDSKIAEEIKDERLGEKIQVLRTLRILEKQRQSLKDLKTIKTDLVDALNASESKTRIALNELQPNSRIDQKLADHLKNGLQVGREKMLERFLVLEQLPPDYQEQGFMELKERLNKLFAKL